MHPGSNSRTRRVLACLPLTLTLVPVVRGDDDEPKEPLPELQALAPHEVLASGLRSPWGAAVGPGGRIFFTDEKEGALFEIRDSLELVQLTDELKKPRGIVADGSDALLLVAEEWRPQEGAKRRGVILRYDLVFGAVSVVAEGLKHPRDLAGAPDGVLFVVADGRLQSGNDDEDDENDDDSDSDAEDEDADEDDDGDENEGEDDDGDENGTLFRWTQGTGFEVVARGFDRPAGLIRLPEGSFLVAAERYRAAGERLEGSVFRVSASGQVTVELAERRKEPTGLAQSGPGGVFTSGRQRSGGGSFPGQILKLGEAASFASGLARPRGLAFHPDGALIAADAKAGVVVRFGPPPEPVLDLPDPAFTNQNPFPLAGTAAVGSQVLVLSGVTRTTGGADSDGAFRVDVPLSPNEENLLRVFAIGAGGAGLASKPATAVVTHDDIDPEIVTTADPPPNDQGWNRTDVTVTFACSDAGSGVADCPDPVVVTDEGAQQVVTGTATDRAGNSATATAVVSVDRTAPEITPVTTPPPNGAGWHKSDVTVSFDAFDSLSGVASVSPTRVVDFEGDGQVIRGEARDRAGNATSTSAVVNIDKTSPVLNLISPVDGTVRRTPSIAVTGVASDVNPITSITLNDEPIGSGGQFSAQLDLVEGPQSVSVRATDIAGNAGSVSASVVFRSPPALRITAPEPFAALSEAVVTVSGSIDDGQASVVVGPEAVPAVVEGNTFRAEGVRLREGLNVLTAVGTDADGNAATDSVAVVLDTTRPRIVVDWPPPQSATGEPSVIVAGRVVDSSTGTLSGGGLQVSVNGVSAAVSNGAFLSAAVPLGPGANTLTATATDAVGNTASATVTVLRETPAGPSISVVSGNGQRAGIGELLPDALIVRLADPVGGPLPNRQVIFGVVQNNGRLTDSGGRPVRKLLVATDENGEAAVRLTLGTRAGPGLNRVEARVVGVSGAGVFLATGAPHPPAKVNVDSGNGQSGVLGQPLARPFVAVVTDEGHNRLAGVPVTFSVVAGEGDFNGETTLTVDRMVEPWPFSPSGSLPAWTTTSSRPRFPTSLPCRSPSWRRASSPATRRRPASAASSSTTATCPFRA